MEEQSKPAAAYKRVEDIKESFHQKAVELNVDPSVRAPFLDFLMEENRQAWIRGKEYGWKKAWAWKMRQKETA